MLLGCWVNPQVFAHSRDGNSIPVDWEFEAETPVWIWFPLQDSRKLFLETSPGLCWHSPQRALFSGGTHP